MDTNLSIAQAWERFCRETGTAPDTSFEAWAFGAAPDKLADLVLGGVKTATASAYELYALDGEPIPQSGELSLILSGNDEPQCVIRTTRVTVKKFREVTAEHAYKEGEGDRSLAYWREVHREFFTDELAGAGLPFSEDMSVVCEEFELIWRVRE